MQNNNTSIKMNQRLVYASKRSAFSTIGLPILLLLSFVWLNFYSNYTNLNTMIFIDDSTFGSITSYIVFSMLIAAIVDYILFELFFFVYRLFLGFSIYSFMIPKYVMLDKFRIWYIVRNIVLGIIFNLRFLFPYISVYLCVFELILNFLFIICLYYDLKKDYVETLVAQFVFKTLTVPVVLYEIYIVIKLMVGVL